MVGPFFFPVVTDTARHNARTGIQTVTRSLSAGLAEIVGTVPLIWHTRRHYLHGLRADWAENLGMPPHPPRINYSLANPRNWHVAAISKGRHSHAPLHMHPAYRDHLKGAWLILPEIMNGKTAIAIMNYGRTYGMKVAAIFHDAIPLFRPDLTARDAAWHESYMRALSFADAVLPVSDTSRDDFESCLTKWKVRVPVVIGCPLPAEISKHPRETKAREPHAPPVTILCVSTLEPRKNHMLLIKSFLAFTARHPELRVNLHLAGDRYWSAPEIEAFVKSAAVRHDSIHWHINPSPEDLRFLYHRCDFTVYPSFLEGFGLPIAESVWFARPCICANFGAMRTSGSGGGCYMVDVKDERALADALELLTLNETLRAKLAEEALQRPLRTWRDYASDVLSTLNSLR